MAEMASEYVAALCDVDARHLGKAAQEFPKARQYRDFRKMIDEAQDLDGIVISTPHHIHAHATARALRAGNRWPCSSSRPAPGECWKSALPTSIRRLARRGHSGDRRKIGSLHLMRSMVSRRSRRTRVSPSAAATARRSG
jgi:hypothetical protein